MENLTIARPYAKALFEIANQGSDIDKWESSLELLVELINNNAVKELICDPFLAWQSIAATLINIYEKKNIANKTLENFINILANNKRLIILPEILIQFINIKEQEINEINCIVYSAWAMQEYQKQQIITILEKNMQSKILLTTELMPELIGGIKIEIGNWVYDGSIKEQLNQLMASIIV